MQRAVELIQKSVLLCALCLGAWCVQQATSQAETAEETKALTTARQLHRSGGYPAHLPKGQPPPRPTSGCRGMRMKSSSFGAGCASITPWLLLLVVLVLLISAVVPALARREPKADAPAPKEAVSYTPEILGRTLEQDASLDDFVRGQDWEGAICFLLYQAMQRLGWKPQGRGKSQTAREVVSQVPRQERRAAPLYALLGLAEQVRFGGVDATEALYDEAQAAFGDFQRQPPGAAKGPSDAAEGPSTASQRSDATGGRS